MVEGREGKEGRKGRSDRSMMIIIVGVVTALDKNQNQHSDQYQGQFIRILIPSVHFTLNHGVCM